MGKMKYTSVLILIFTAFHIEQVLSAPVSSPVTIGTNMTLDSAILGETRSLVIGKPPSYAATLEARYPVLYLLDGPAQFHATTGLIAFLSQIRSIPELLVVAVANDENRSRDLTPPPEVPRKGYGGANNFLGFITEELIPWVDSNYRTEPYRILIGYSWGGTFALHTMITQPQAFNGYIVISPGIFWDEQRLVSNIEAFLKERKEFKRDLYMTMGNESSSGYPLEMLGGFRKLTGVLGENSLVGFRWGARHMPEESHYSIPHRSMYQGLKAIFEGWRLTDPAALFEVGGMEAIEAHYAVVSDRLGYEREVPLDTTQVVLNSLFRADRLEDVASLLAASDDLFLPRAFERLAESYEQRGDIELALEAFKKLLEISPGNTDARKKLADAGHRFADPDATVTEEVLQGYTGRYELPPKYTVVVTIENNKLFVQGKNVQEKTEVRPMTQNRFFIEGSRLQYSFSAGEDGRAENVTIYGFGVPITAGRVE